MFSGFNVLHMKDEKLETMIGQLVSIGFEETAVSQNLVDLIKKYKFGNYSIYAHNCTSKEQTRKLNTDLFDIISRSTGHVPIISVDQEGGMVTRLNDKYFTHFPGAMAIAATANPENAYIVGLLTAKEMRGAGFNTNCAPVVDINTSKVNPVIGVRSYGDNSDQVSQYSLKMAEGLIKGNILPVFKHFPGHGGTSQDSHFDLPHVDKTLSELYETELIPYINGIKAGYCHAIMTSHIIFTNIEPEGLPATLSKYFLTDLLRHDLGFKGIVKTDDLLMDAIKQHYGIVEGAISALRAGADIVSISRDINAAVSFVTKVKEMVQSKELPISVVEQAYARVTEEKEKLPDQIIDEKEYTEIGSEEHQNTAQEINDTSITLYGDHTDCIPEGKTLVITTNAFNQTNIKNPLLLELNASALISDSLNCDGILIPIKPTEEEQVDITAKAKNYDTIVFCSYNASIFTQQIDLTKKLEKLNKKIIYIAMRNPYDLAFFSQNRTRIATYEYTPHSIQSVIKVLKGVLTPKGKLCVKI